MKVSYKFINLSNVFWISCAFFNRYLMLTLVFVQLSISQPQGSICSREAVNISSADGFFQNTFWSSGERSTWSTLNFPSPWSAVMRPKCQEISQTIAHIVLTIDDWSAIDGSFSISIQSSSFVDKSRIDASDDVAKELFSPRRIRRFSSLSSWGMLILNNSGTA